MYPLEQKQKKHCGTKNPKLSQYKCNTYVPASKKWKLKSQTKNEN